MTNDKLKITRLSEFERDLKKLKKRYRTLDEDLENLIKFSISLYHLNGIPQSIVDIPGLGLSPQKFFKVRKFASKSMKGKGAYTGLRLIYKYDEETQTIDLIEIYYKGDKANEDRDRILKKYR